MEAEGRSSRCKPRKRGARGAATPELSSTNFRRDRLLELWGVGRLATRSAFAEPPASVRIDASHGEAGKLMTPQSLQPRHHSLLLPRVVHALRLRERGGGNAAGLFSRRAMNADLLHATVIRSTDPYPRCEACPSFVCAPPPPPVCFARDERPNLEGCRLPSPRRVLTRRWLWFGEVVRGAKRTHSAQNT
jgi:hypothetical protein